MPQFPLFWDPIANPRLVGLIPWLRLFCWNYYLFIEVTQLILRRQILWWNKLLQLGNQRVYRWKLLVKRPEIDLGSGNVIVQNFCVWLLRVHVSCDVCCNVFHRNVVIFQFELLWGLFFWAYFASVSLLRFTLICVLFWTLRFGGLVSVELISIIITHFDVSNPLLLDKKLIVQVLLT